MHTTGHQRAPGSFSPLQPSISQTPQAGQVDSSDSDESSSEAIIASRRPQVLPAHRPSFLPAQALRSSGSTSSLQNFSRPSVQYSRTGDLPTRNASPLTGVLRKSSTPDFHRLHTRKHSQTQGFFEPTLPKSSALSMANQGHLSASQIAAQAAMQHLNQHQRQRSQTVPSPQSDSTGNGGRRPSRGPTSPPVLSLTEASGPSQSGFGNGTYHNGLLGNPTNAATTAANVVFPRSPQLSPGLPPTDFSQMAMDKPDKPVKAEKSKVKLFSRPGKIGISKDKDLKDKGLPSPSKLGSYAMNSLQRSAMSTNSLAESSTGSSMYSQTNSSSATIRPSEPEKEKEKEKHKHHFLSRQKHKLSNKDEHHLPLSSAASNSKPVDPNAPSSLYNFNLPPSPGPSSTSFSKSMSGLDLRHGGRALREKKKEEKAAHATSDSRDIELSYTNSSEWPGPSSMGSGSASFLGPSTTSSVGNPPSLSLYGLDTGPDLAKYGLNNMTADDAWPFLKAKLLIIFEGEDLRLHVEDFNRLVTTHIQRCIQKRTPQTLIEDLRDLLVTGFSSLEQTLRPVPSERLASSLVELWLFTFTSILPYMQAVFLPLDLAFSGASPLLSPTSAADFWALLPYACPLDVRKIVLIAFRDTVILPRFETLKSLFSRLSLESIGSLNTSSSEILSSSPDSFTGGRPGTAMSLDPSLGSYNSQGTTLLGDMSGSRSRAISNVSYTSDPASRNETIAANLGSLPPPPGRPFTPGGHPSVGFGAREQWQREVNEGESRYVTETVGRMLQCVSVLASVGGHSSATSNALAQTPTNASAGSTGMRRSGSLSSRSGLGIGVAGLDESDCQRKVEELCKTLKLNWLGRGRTGRNRRGFVGSRVTNPGARRDEGSML
jgi:hypothetical protein